MLNTITVRGRSGATDADRWAERVHGQLDRDWTALHEACAASNFTAARAAAEQMQALTGEELGRGRRWRRRPRALGDGSPAFSYENWIGGGSHGR